MNALEIKGLYKKFDEFYLDHLDLTLPCGSIMGLIGENGAGKSTAIKLIAGMLSRDGGSVNILGKDDFDDSVKEDLGIVPDEIGIPGCITAAEVGRIMEFSFNGWEAETYSNLLSRLSVPENVQFKNLSRGMKMKLGIAAAMSHGAKLLLLDEATSGLDPVVRDDLLDILCEFTRDEGHSVLISSHIVSDLEKICDYIAFLHKGKLLLFEEKDRLLEDYAMARVTEAELEALPKPAVRGTRRGKYGVEALVERRLVPSGAALEKPTLEDIIVFFARGDKE